MAAGSAANTDVLVMAALKWRPNAVLCDETAAQFSYWPELRDHTVHLAGVRGRGKHPGFAMSRRIIPVDLISSRGDVRITRPDLTALDLAVRTGGESIDRLLRSRMGTLSGMADALAATPFRRGNSDRRGLLLDSRSEPWSTAERLAHRVLRSAGIQGWVANYRVRCGGRTRYLDIGFPDLKLAVEIDGRIHQFDPELFEDDRTRQNDLVLNGWRVLRFTWWMLVNDPAGVVEAINTAVMQTARKNSAARSRI